LYDTKEKSVTDFNIIISSSQESVCIIYTNSFRVPQQHANRSALLYIVFGLRSFFGISHNIFVAEKFWRSKEFKIAAAGNRIFASRIMQPLVMMSEG
jgi:hypothetical protein